MVLHPTSLPGPGPIGCFGQQARDWVDWLAAAGFSWWQVCPLGPTGYGDSPYQPLSVFALNPSLIDLKELVEAGLITTEAFASLDTAEGRVDYGIVWHRLRPVLQAAAEKARLEPVLLARWGNFAAFCTCEAGWLNDWQRFAALRESNGFVAPVDWKIHQVDAAGGERAAILQFIAAAQWRKLHGYAAQRGVKILGDEPIYVSADGADRWANPRLFSQGDVAGVPPDYFSTEGQLWGNPLYDWAHHAANDFAWWRARVARDVELFDAIRLDHFRGLCDFWAVPQGATTAQDGAWQQGPGNAFFRALGSQPIVAEDLGLLSPGVHTLRAEAQLPGMAVLQFGFPLTEDNPHHPSTITPDRIAYTGTHDNDTVVGWLSGLDEATYAEVNQALGEPASPQALWRAVLASPAIGAFAPVQDLLALSSEARLNTPGTATGNWTWRMRESDFTQLKISTPSLRHAIEATGRVLNTRGLGD